MDKKLFQKKFSIIYVTFGDVENAREIAKLCLEKNFVACVNIYPEIESLYCYNNKLQEHKEISAIFKTTTNKVAEVINFIKEKHRYECPCIISFYINEGDDLFLNWIAKQCKMKSLL